LHAYDWIKDPGRTNRVHRPSSLIYIKLLQQPKTLKSKCFCLFFNLWTSTNEI